MLSYVFWHWIDAARSAADYEAMLCDFHASLAAHPPQGLLQSAAYALAGAPWAAGGQPAYEDWYILTGSAALDPLNDAAVAPPHLERHNTVAAVVGGGTAGLYRLRQGAPLGTQAHYAWWFGKPAGMSYPTLYNALAPLVDRGGTALWGRQMVLGPTPEFCLQSVEPITQPALLSGALLPLRTVWPPV